MKTAQLAVIMLLLAGCRPSPVDTTFTESEAAATPKIWELSLGEANRANFVARRYAFAVLSDTALKNAGIETAPANRQAAVNSGIDPLSAPPFPPDFTIGGRLFSKFKKRYVPGHDGNRKILIMSFFDSEVFPDWEKHPEMDGGFPAHFTVTIDWAKHDVIEHGAFSK